MGQARPLPTAFFVNGRPDVTHAVQVGVQWLTNWTAKHGGDPVIITPGREPEGRVLQAAPQAARFTRQTFRTMLSSPWRGGAVLVFWADDKVLGRIDDNYQVKAVCAVLDSLTHAPLWLKARQPKEIGGAGSVLPLPVDLDPIARIALEHLTHSINLGTGLVHPSDRSHAIAIVETLHAAGKRLSPTDAHAWAMQNGWRADGAEDLRKIVAGIAAGKRFRQTGPYHPSPDMLARWEREATGEK